MSLELGCATVNAGDRKSLLDALKTISEFDLDFTGANGVMYLWDEVWEANGFKDYEDFKEKQACEPCDLKFDSNLAYLLFRVADIKDDEECVEQFFRVWMENDRGYYSDHKLLCVHDDACNIVAISFGVVS